MLCEFALQHEKEERESAQKNYSIRIYAHSRSVLYYVISMVFLDHHQSYAIFLPAVWVCMCVCVFCVLCLFSFNIFITCLLFIVVIYVVCMRESWENPNASRTFVEQMARHKDRERNEERRQWRFVAQTIVQILCIEMHLTWFMCVCDLRLNFRMFYTFFRCFFLYI